MWGLLTSYALMYIAQTQSGAILGVLHGAEAAEKALFRSVQPDLGIRDFCREYAAAHFDATSNILHAAAMISTLWLFVFSTSLFFFGFGRFMNYLYLPPLYYLPAWLGHFVFQKDIPAVFTYGTTVQGLLNGELCAFKDLFHGGIARNITEWMYSAALVVVMIASLLQFGKLWPQTIKKVKSKKLLTKQH